MPLVLFNLKNSALQSRLSITLLISDLAFCYSTISGQDGFFTRNHVIKVTWKFWQHVINANCQNFWHPMALGCINPLCFHYFHRNKLEKFPDLITVIIWCSDHTPMNEINQLTYSKATSFCSIMKPALYLL